MRIVRAATEVIEPPVLPLLAFVALGLHPLPFSLSCVKRAVFEEQTTRFYQSHLAANCWATVGCLTIQCRYSIAPSQFRFLFTTIELDPEIPKVQVQALASHAHGLPFFLYRRKLDRPWLPHRFFSTVLDSCFCLGTPP